MPSSANEVPAIVLLAEDETLVRLVTNDILTHADYRVVEARDGREALDILGAQNTICALVTDVNMPHVDGLALAKVVRERWPHIGVVVASARAVPAGLPAGARFISKPYQQEDLIAELEAVIADTAHLRGGRTGYSAPRPGLDPNS